MYKACACSARLAGASRARPQQLQQPAAQHSKLASPLAPLAARAALRPVLVLALPKPAVVVHRPLVLAAAPAGRAVDGSVAGDVIVAAALAGAAPVGGQGAARRQRRALSAAGGPLARVLGDLGDGHAGFEPGAWGGLPLQEEDRREGGGQRALPLIVRRAANQLPRRLAGWLAD